MELSQIAPLKPGSSNQTGGLNIIQTDLNNDGCKDILILRGGWEWARRKSLLRNNCNGTFTDVTRESWSDRPRTFHADRCLDRYR